MELSSLGHMEEMAGMEQLEQTAETVVPILIKNWVEMGLRVQMALPEQRVATHLNVSFISKNLQEILLLAAMVGMVEMVTVAETAKPQRAARMAETVETEQKVEMAENGGKSGNGANIVIYIEEGVEYILIGTHDVSPGQDGKGGAAGKGGSKKSDGKPGSPGTSGSAGKSGSAGQAGQSENISILPYRDPVD